MIHKDDNSYESDITHVIVPNSMMDWGLYDCWILWACFITGKTFVSEDHLHKCREENRIILEKPFIPKRIRKLQSAMNHDSFTLRDPPLGVRI